MKATQLKNPQNNRWVKRNSDSGQFQSVKSDNNPYKNIPKEKP